MLSVIISVLLTLANYAPPVDYKMLLAGNFGEPRPHHFHGGIDIKTDGVQGKHIYSIGDGYVCRITVGLYGFGNAVYVRHPEGYTSVYCHLRSFSPKINKLLGLPLRPNQKDTVDVRLTALDCPVSKGQLIALSGNTGHSQAPHLHLEIHDTRTWDMLDPLDFLGQYVHDGVEPMAHGLMACPLVGEGMFNNSNGQQVFGFPSHRLEQEFYAWGKVGFAIWANDYMDSTYNHYGIRETILMVDGREVFHSNVNRIPVGSNRQINAWGDYLHWRRSNVWYMKSFVQPGLHLPILQTDENNGYIDFNEERPYRLTYVLRDFRGNEARYEFTVIGRKTNIASRCSRNNVFYDRASLISLPGMQLTVPARQVAENIYIRPVTSEGRWSDKYIFSEKGCPLFGWAELSIAVKQKVAHPEMFYIRCGDKNLGGVYHDGWVTTSIRELGATYELAIDTTKN